jgi:flagellar protein FlaG
VDINNITGSGISPWRDAQSRAQTAPAAGGGAATPAERKQNADAAASVRDATSARDAEAADPHPEHEEQMVQESVDKINALIRPYVTSLQFSVDRDVGKIVVKIMDSETQEIIKQIPSEKVLALAKALAETFDKPEGLLVRQEV